ncbi:2-succinylbenzoate--CoA ligase [Vibrio ruber DSM 16370]|uniref:2-succinylbenzoate--CoA ligase n=1 Tax=Vibrio ruber (strain DSM 16370 / JCM 11486 / BCRC 17186 / CECT 7878 / LMG 23124 / VR1) TaxID=1123498 RepID=A0A1R4LS47_VIBR1|nr:o-succinylbenzoate--CoA ligase [Vibrio ruber]SJN59283.1 2-succinylbenzoate--CoA ligase [Vibrio ruber DSM 16370]
MTNGEESGDVPWLRWAKARPTAVALKVGQQSYCWQAVAERVAAIAAALQQQGVGTDDVVTLVGKNHPDMVWLFLARLYAGALTAFVPPQPVVMLQRKLATIYRPHQTRWLFCTDPSDAAALQMQLPDCRMVECQQTADAVLPPHYHAEQLSSLIFTSGSTGDAKAVAHTSHQHFASAQGLLSQFHFSAGDTWLLSLPVYHVSGLSIIYRWLQAGACLRIGRVAAGELADVTHASLVPTQLQRLLAQPIPLALTHVLLGGSHIPAELARQAAALGIETWLGYGMTEAASTVTAKQVGGLESCGRVLPFRQVKIADERIYISGDTLACGYYRQGELTPLCDETGWFDSKDMGYWHDQELHVTGRADNLFISGGENIHCEEIEAVLVRHPQIETAVIVPVADATYGMRPVAVIDCEQDWQSMSADISAWLEGRLEKFKWPDSYYRLPEHCRPQGIKISRAAVKTWLNAAIEQGLDPDKQL